MASDSKRVQAVFLAAVELPAAERAAVLDHECHDDVELRQRVEALLQAHDAPGSFLDRPAVDAGATGDEEPGEKKTDGSGGAAPTEGPGTRIGPYKLLQQIGEGGMGVVYMAEQERPVRRRVALKIIKPGMDSAAVIRRFEAERQALALMDHTHIAKVLDAGTTDTGRPYFVMELVKGVPITKYCDELHLAIRERLELFVPVCQAIQHAHQKGIIHRDLKPSNVLVCMQDGRPAPKVIDFGVAKALHQKLTEQTLMTAFGQMIGTLEYMSPEQAELSALDIDTRADIYALGALLYELLTGTTPLDRNWLKQAALGEVLRVIREVEPATPSSKLSSSAELPAIAAKRKLEPKRLTRLVHGDLDWIVMKCLEKDRGRRYETADGLARDVQRYLADEPVLAGPPSTGYRLGKFVRRNRISVLTAAGILVVLIAGIVGTTLGLLRAIAAERLAGERLQRAEQAEAEATDRRNAAVAAEAKAVQEAAIAKAVTSFLQKDLLEMADSEVQLSGGWEPDPEIKLRTLLERAEARVKERFADQPEVEAAVRYTLAKAFYGVGELDRSTEQFAKVRAYREAHLGPHHPDTVECMLDLAKVLGGTVRRPEAVTLSEAALQLIKAKLSDNDSMRLRAMEGLACAYLNVGRNEESLALFEETYRLMKAKFGPDDPRTLNCLGNIPLAYAGRYAEAVPLLEEAHRLKKTKLGPNNPGTLVTEFSLAMQYLNLGRVDKALPLCEQNFKHKKDIYGSDHPLTLRAMYSLAIALKSSGREAEALPLEEEAWRLSKAKLGAEHLDTLWYLSGLANSYALAKQPEKAIPLYREYLVWVNKIFKSDEHRLAQAKAGVGQGFLRLGLFAEAEKELRASLAVLQKSASDLWTTFHTQSLLGGALLGQKKYAEAEPLLLSGYEGMKQREGKIPQASRKYLIEALERLVQLYDAWGKKDEAAKWRKKLEDVREPADKREPK